MDPRPAGRPRAFDRDAAVVQAARLFWRHGFSGTSTRTLTTTLGISSSSLYAAFGSKAGLFEEAVRLHTGRYAAIYAGAATEGSLAAVVERLLTESVLEFTDSGPEHTGCLTSSAAMADSPATLDIRAHVRERQEADEAVLRARVERAVSDADVPADTDPMALTALIQTLWHGLSVRADLGAQRADLLATARLASHHLTPADASGRER